MVKQNPLMNFLTYLGSMKKDIFKNYYNLDKELARLKKTNKQTIKQKICGRTILFLINGNVFNGVVSDPMIFIKDHNLRRMIYFCILALKSVFINNCFLILINLL